MKWDVHENDPPIAGAGARIYCDGVELTAVTRFDTDEGWAEVLRRDGDGRFVINEAGDDVERDMVRGEIVFVPPPEPQERAP